MVFMASSILNCFLLYHVEIRHASETIIINSDIQLISSPERNGKFRSNSQSCSFSIRSLKSFWIYISVHPVCPVLLELVLVHAKLTSHTLESGLLHQLQSFLGVFDCTYSGLSF